MACSKLGKKGGVPLSTCTGRSHSENISFLQLPLPLPLQCVSVAHSLLVPFFSYFLAFSRARNNDFALVKPVPVFPPSPLARLFSSFFFPRSSLSLFSLSSLSSPFSGSQLVSFRFIVHRLIDTSSCSFFFLHPFLCNFFLSRLPVFFPPGTRRLSLIHHK